MQTRIKIVTTASKEFTGHILYYPQYKCFGFWRNFYFRIPFNGDFAVVKNTEEEAKAYLDQILENKIQEQREREEEKLRKTIVSTTYKEYP